MSATYKYILDFVGNNRQLVGAIDQNKAKLTELDRKADDSKKSIANVFSGTKELQAGLMSFAGTVGLAFGAREIISFTGELVKLGGEATGVQAAFNKIADSSDLTKLRNSVHGTVSDLELMKRAVSAQNFGIPVKELGNLFAFATKRAQDTGQSVDYLVDSIVTGIGRKSPLILDNLGISATQLKDKMKGVAIESAGVADITKAVGEIAADSFKKTGDILDTNAIKLQSLSAQWENFKMQLATNEGFQETASKGIDHLSNAMEAFFSKNVAKADKFNAPFVAMVEGFPGLISYLDDTAKKSRGISQNFQANSEAVKDFQKTYNSFLPAAKSFRFYDKTDDVKNFNEFWATVTKTALPALFKVIPDNVNSSTKTYANTYEGLNEKLKDYNAQLAQIAPNDTAATVAKLQQILAIEKQIKAVDTLKTKLEEANKAKEYWAKFDDNPRNPISSKVVSSFKIGDKGKMEIGQPNKIEDLFDFKKLSPMNDMLEQNKKKVESLATAWYSFGDKYQQVIDRMAKGGEAINTMQVAGGQYVNAMMGFAQSGADSLKEFASAARDAALQVIDTMIAEGVAGAVKGALVSVPFPLNMILAATAAAGAVTLFNSVIPKFADGGIAYGPTLGLMGEYPGARSNPEIIAPLSKLQAMIGGGGSQQIILQPGLDFDGDKMRIYLKRLEAKAAKRTGRSPL